MSGICFDLFIFLNSKKNIYPGVEYKDTCSLGKLPLETPL